MSEISNLAKAPLEILLLHWIAKDPDQEIPWGSGEWKKHEVVMVYGQKVKPKDWILACRRLAREGYLKKRVKNLGPYNKSWKDFQKTMTYYKLTDKGGELLKEHGYE